MVLQETKLQQCNDLLVWQCWSNKSVNWLDSPSQGSSGGILCMWDSAKIQVLDSLIGPYSITLLCKNIADSFHWMFTSLYAPCASNTEDLKLFWREIEEVRCFWRVPWVVGGDFNEIRFTHERTSGGEVTPGMTKFNRFISRHQLIDLPLIGATYTWTNNQSPSIRSRIDRMFVSPDWECQYPKVIQQALARPCSDHNPIALISQGLKHGPPPFRCEYFWFSHPNFLSFVKDMWFSFNVSGSAGFIFCKKLQLLKIQLKEWSKLEYGAIDSRLEELEDIFTTLDAAEDANNGLTDSQWQERTTARQDYCKLTSINAEKLRSRARVTHIKDFENNTKYFHRLANEIRRRSYIGSIKVNNTLTSDEAQIKDGIVSYFQNIFQSQSSRNISMDSMNFSKISEDMNATLQRDFEEDECLAAIKLLGQLKYPGPDGFPIKFYLLCWNTIKDDFLKVMKELQNKGFLDWRLKNTFIALIPKKDSVEEIKDLRPISLIHGVYKIMSKILAERLKLVLPHIISPQQSAFVKKRQILDGVLIANELIDSRLRSGKPGILCKIDFEKAFDHVNWDFIEDIFQRMGFGDKWRRWIRCCMEFVKFSVLINGSATGYFTSKKGIRQGDPISPFLFLLVGEALSYMIKTDQEQGLISGFQVKPNGMLISHLHFADDTLIFMDADVEQVKSLRLILLSFEMLTGLKINFAKSQIYGVGCVGDLSIFSSILGCYSGLLPTTYLGLPLGDRCGGYAKWDKVIEKFTKKLAGWKKSLLSRAGKITLINSVLASLPIYYLSLFEMPASVLKKIERIMKDFLWNDNKGNKKLHLVKWNALARRKKSGGLGIKNLKLLNHALLSKWSWRYAVDDTALWRALVEEKYNPGEVSWASKIPTCTYGKSVWRAIMKHHPIFIKHIHFKVNNGNLCRFWEDNWLYQHSIKSCYPNLYAVSRAKSLTVATMRNDVDNTVTWNLHIPRRLNAAARVELILLSSDLSQFNFNDSSPDELQWSLSKSKKFSVSTAYDSLAANDAALLNDTALLTGPIFTLIWKLKCPPKIGFFLWLLAYNRLPTRDLLIRRGMDVPQACLLCDKDENASHLLLHCTFARQVWIYFMKHFNWHFTMPPDMTTMLQAWVSIHDSKESKAVWSLLPAAIVWSLWKERNDRAFKGIGGGTSPQGSAGGAANTHLTQHQARIQAAAAAAAIYEKSYVYPSANTLAWSPGYAVLPRGSTSSSDSSNTESISGGQTNVTYPQVSQGAFVPLRAFSSVNLKDGDKSGNDLNGYGSHLEVQERLLKQQIEVLQSQLLQLNHHKSDSTNPSNPSPADNKGKGIASSSSENDRNAEEVKMKREKIQ